MKEYLDSSGENCQRQVPGYLIKFINERFSRNTMLKDYCKKILTDIQNKIDLNDNSNIPEAKDEIKKEISHQKDTKLFADAVAMKLGWDMWFLQYKNVGDLNKLQGQYNQISHNAQNKINALKKLIHCLNKEMSKDKTLMEKLFPCCFAISKTLGSGESVKLDRKAEAKDVAEKMTRNKGSRELVAKTNFNL